METMQSNTQSHRSQGGFKGLLTKLLAEAFIEEDTFEPMPQQATIKTEKELNLFLRQFTKTFT